MRLILIGLCALPLALGGCGSEDESGQGPAVVATTGIAADLAERVAGPGVEVTQIVPDGASPHDFQLSARARQALEEADLVVGIGAGLEPGIPLDDLEAPKWLLSENTGELLPFEEGEDAEEGHAGEEEDEHGTEDPHVWMDPARVAMALGSLADALAAADPERAEEHRAAARRYARQLRDLDAEIERTLAAVEPADRELVTSHDSLGYFADRYRFEVLATAFPASGPEAEASAAALREVIEAARDAEVPAVFAQEDDDPEALRLVAEEAGVEIEEGLLVESPGSAGTYEEMLRRDAELIANALGG